MRLPLKVGLPLLGLLLLGMAFVEGREQLVLVLAAMGVALWSAFSLPHPGPRPQDPPLGAPEAPDPGADDVQDGSDDAQHGADGNGSGRPPSA
jgi:hypothetical protein